MQQHKKEIKEGFVTWIQSLGMDYTLTVSFKQWYLDQYRFREPSDMCAHIERLILSSGYIGPYAIAVHDKHGAANLHAHLLLQTSETPALVRRKLFPYADLTRDDDGIIRGNGAYQYWANRALERYPDHDGWLVSKGAPSTPKTPKPRRRWRRKRGRGSKSCTPCTQ